MTTAASGAVFLSSLVVALVIVHAPLGDYMYRVYTRETHSRGERFIYRMVGVDAGRERIAKARGISAAEVRAVIGAHQRGRLLGFLGQARVSVVAVNLELDRRHPVAGCCRGG